MKRFKKAVAIVLCLALPASMMAETVKIILKDGSVVQGELLGIENGTISIQKGNKSLDYTAKEVKKVFDSDGKRVDLESAPSVDEEKRVETAPAKAVPKRRGASGARIAGNIMAGVGLVGLLAGGAIGIVAQGNMDNATSTYYTGPYYAAGAVYTIEGKKGYYTSTQYNEYYSSLGWRNGGYGVAIVGGVLAIAGVIVSVAGGRRSDSAALMDLRDDQLALNVPLLQWDPARNGLQGTLLHAEF